MDVRPMSSSQSPPGLRPAAARPGPMYAAPARRRRAARLAAAPPRARTAPSTRPLAPALVAGPGAAARPPETTTRPVLSLRVIGAAAALVALLHPAGATAGGQLQEQIYRARDRVLPALVHIQPVLEVFRAGERGKVAVTGSGVIFSEDGLVLTNNHVVERAQRLTCTLADQQEVIATLVGRDPYTDLAVIRIDPERVHGSIRPARLGRSADLQAGDLVMALGSPLGLARSLSVGVVSTVNRYFPESRMPDGSLTGTFNTWIQTDAAINPGNSGGPLVNLRGEVVGINARAIPVVGENLGFAIPVDLAREVAEKLLREGEVRRSWIGVSWQHLEAAPAITGAAGDGALVASVVAGSPAEEAGLQPGDIVLALEGQELAAQHEEQLPALRKLVADLPVGEAVEVRYLRGDEERHSVLRTLKLEDGEGIEIDFRPWGFTARGISEEIARQFRLDDRTGALVTGVKPNSFAFEAGMRPGDIVRQVEGEAIPNLRALEQRIDELLDAEAPKVLMELRRGRFLAFALLEPTYSSREGVAPESRSGEEGRP